LAASTASAEGPQESVSWIWGMVKPIATVRRAG